MKKKRGIISLSLNRMWLKILIFMKLVMLLLITGVLQANATIHAQNVKLTMKLENVSLIDFFTEIKKHSEFDFLYNHDLVESKGNVSIDFNNENLVEILDDVLSSKELNYEIDDNVIFISKGKSAPKPIPVIEEEQKQEKKEITGTVTDVDGSPLPGVAIVVSGTTIGTITNIDGDFSFQIPLDAKLLEISFLGMKNQTIEIGSSSAFKIIMEVSNEALEEVVVTAFGIERQKKALGYSSQEVQGASLTEARETNIASSLSGKFAGVQVVKTGSIAGGSTSVIIRGASSIQNSNQPLYVVDGVPIDNQNLQEASKGGGYDYGDGISGINPDDVESINVLKGPNAAALYGSRGANGVILITTKSGKSRKGIGVEVNSNVTFDIINLVPKFQSSYGIGKRDSEFKGNEYIEIDGVTYPKVRSNSINNWGQPLDPNLMVYMSGFNDLVPRPYAPQPRDNIKEFYDTGITFTNSVAFTGGGKNTTFRLSLSDMDNKAIVPLSKFNRQTVNFRATSKLTDKLSIDAKVNYIKHKAHNRPRLGRSSLSVPYTLTLTARNIDIDWLKDYKHEDGSMRYFSSKVQNPYWLINEVTNDDTRDRIIGYVSLKYQLTDWLSVQARTGTDFYTDQRSNKIGKGTLGSSYRNGVIENNSFHVKESNSDILILASKGLSKNLSGSITMGANHLYRSRELTGIKGSNLNIDNLYHISNAALITPTYKLVQYETNSVFGAAQLAYKNYLFLDITSRNDWSSTLGVNNYSFYYPSSSLSFIFSDALKINSEVFTFGKARISYAEVGNSAGAYLTKQGFSILSTNLNGQQEARINSSIALHDLKNELTRSLELGADLRFFKNRLGIDFTYYQSSSLDQILSIKVPAATGFSSKVVNAGEIQNKGTEVTLNTTPIQSSNGLRWDLSINWSKNNSKVVELAPGIDAHIMSDGSWGTIEARVGEKFGNIIGYPYKRTEDGRILLDSDSRAPYNDNEKVILGNIQPDWLAGISSSLTFKGLTLGALIDIKQGGELLSFSKYHGLQQGTAIQTENRDIETLVWDGVVEVTDAAGNVTGYEQNTQPVEESVWYYGIIPASKITEGLILDAGFVALRELSLGYSLPSSLMAKTPFTGAKISVIGRNLGYLVEHMEGMGVSPEATYNTSFAAQGYEDFTMPTTMSIGFNIKLTL